LNSLCEDLKSSSEEKVSPENVARYKIPKIPQGSSVVGIDFEEESSLLSQVLSQ
jgi:hypothetical protein